METKIRLLPLRAAKTIAFKEEMQEAFQHGFQSYYKGDNQWQVLPDKDFYLSLETEGAEAYEAIDEDGLRLGGAIIAIDAAKHHGELAFLYVKVGVQSKGIGQTIWKAIEALESYRSTASRNRDMGNLHTILRPSKHPFLHQPLRIPCRRVLQRSSSRPAHA